MEVRVKVTAGAKHDTLQETKPNQFFATVKDKAEQNMANKKVQQLLAEYFAVPESAVRLIRGHHQSAKVFAVMIK